jgi:hypothetical protein
MNINNMNYSIKFERKLTPVSFFSKGKAVTASRMATTAFLVDECDEKIATATVTPYHKDRYSRKMANDAAVRKMAFSLENSMRNAVLTQFFAKY